MKKHNRIILGFGALALAAGMWSCQADMDNPGLQVPEATIRPNITILDLKNKFENRTVLLDKQEDGSPYIIHGRVVSSDASGNIYQNLVIQDETAALTFSIRQGSMYTSYRLGQDVVVDMTGLYLGYYRGLQQVGAPGDPYNGQPQLGFMAYDYWLAHAQKNGLPDPAMEVVTLDQKWPADNMYAVALTLPIANTDLTRKQSQLVELRNVSFSDADGQTRYGIYQETVSRYLKNEEGDSIAVRISGYSNFYNDTLPQGKGRVRGILGYYGDSWQLTIRDKNDVMISMKGSEKDPYTVDEALLAENFGNRCWTEGYIVGSVKAGENAETADDCIFGPDAEMDNNLLIAGNPDETDLSKCLTVDLPQGSLLRRYGNLVDNPGVYKKKLTISGEIGTFLSHTGIEDNPGTAGTFQIEGVEIKVPTGDFKEIFKSLETGSTQADVTRDWTFENISLASGLSYVWSWKVYNGSGYLNGSAYAGSAKEALAYAVSPVIDLSRMLEAKVNFRHAAKFQTTLRELCGFAVREAGSDKWTEFAIPVWPTAGEWKFVGSGDIDISIFAGKKIQIAFKYGSTAQGADTWEINDATVMAR